jgi:hypothetical protein
VQEPMVGPNRARQIVVTTEQERILPIARSRSTGRDSEEVVLFEVYTLSRGTSLHLFGLSRIASAPCRPQVELSPLGLADFALAGSPLLSNSLLGFGR